MHLCLPGLVLPQSCCWLNLSSGDAALCFELNLSSSGAGITKSDTGGLWERERSHVLLAKSFDKQIWSLTKSVTTNSSRPRSANHGAAFYSTTGDGGTSSQTPVCTGRGTSVHEECFHTTFAMAHSLGLGTSTSSMEGWRWLYYTDMMITACAGQSRFTPV